MVVKGRQARGCRKRFIPFDGNRVAALVNNVQISAHSPDARHEFLAPHV